MTVRNDRDGQRRLGQSKKTGTASLDGPRGNKRMGRSQTDGTAPERRDDPVGIAPVWLETGGNKDKPARERRARTKHMGQPA